MKLALVTALGLITAISPALGEAVCTGGNAVRGSDPEPPPVSHGARHVSVVVRHGGEADLPVGLNTLDKPTVIICKGSCLITSDRRFVLVDNGYTPCFYMDAVEGHPRTTYQGTLPVSWAKASAGQHTIQTKLYLDFAGHLYPWEIVYTVYDR